MEQRNINVVLPSLKKGASEKKNQVAAGESNLSFASQKIPSQTVVSGAE